MSPLSRRLWETMTSRFGRTRFEKVMRCAGLVVLDSSVGIQQQVGRVAGLDPHRVEPNRAADGADDFSRQRLHQLRRHYLTGRSRRRALARKHQRRNLVFRQRRIGASASVSTLPSRLSTRMVIS